MLSSRNRKFGKIYILSITEKILVSVLIGITILVLSMFWNLLEYGILFASFGSSTFLLYHDYKRLNNSARSIIGAYAIAGFFGYLAGHYIPTIMNLPENIMLPISAGIAVSLTALSMMLLDFKHGPAVGASLAFVVNKVDVGGMFFLIGGGITILLLSKLLIFMWMEGKRLSHAIRLLILELRYKIIERH